LCTFFVAEICSSTPKQWNRKLQS